MTAFVAVVGFFGVSATEACLYRIKIAKFDRAAARWLASPTASNLIKLCNKHKGAKVKFCGVPGKPIPPLPPGAVCGPAGGGGAGRGGGMAGPGGAGPGGGGVNGPPGGAPIGSMVWVRNHNPFPCTFSYTITPDPGNPAGFTVSPLAGSVLVPAGSTVTVPITVTIGGAVAPGACAFFDVEWTDTCNGLTLPLEFSRFKVRAATTVQVELIPLSLTASPGVPVTASWTVTNLTGSPVSLPYSFVVFPDPASVVPFNTLPFDYPVVNVFPADKSVTGGTTPSIPPGGSIQIDWPDLLPAEYCDPQMVSCCGLEIDGNLSNVMIFNDDTGPDRGHDRIMDLVGTASGGFVQIQMFDGFNLLQAQVPTNPGDLPPQILDQMALDMLNQAQVDNLFNFMPIIDDEGMAVLHPPAFDVQFQSFDPGLNWRPFFPADRDGDVDVDGIDFSQFASCFNGAGNPPRTLGCNPESSWLLDFDDDLDIDGIDFSKFASCFNKAGNPPRTLNCP